MTARAYTVIIPTLNAAGTLRRQLKVAPGQGMAPEEVIIVDSQSVDGIADLAATVPGVQVIPVKREAFDHGGTRDMAVRASATPYGALLTQDALPVDANWAQALLSPFEDERVAQEYVRNRLIGSFFETYRGRFTNCDATKEN